VIVKPNVVAPADVPEALGPQVPLGIPKVTLAYVAPAGEEVSATVMVSVRAGAVSEPVTVSVQLAVVALVRVQDLVAVGAANADTLAMAGIVLTPSVTVCVSVVAALVIVTVSVIVAV
jgi:hypothetical protein